MLAVGRALMADPKILLMDEPSIGLSPILVAEVGKIIRDINKRAGHQHPAGGAERPHGAPAGEPGLHPGERAASRSPGNCEDLIDNDEVKRCYLGGGQAR